jgi:hypothetical protein
MGRHFRAGCAAVSSEAEGAVSFSIGLESGSMSLRFYRKFQKKFREERTGFFVLLRAFLRGAGEKRCFFDGGFVVRSW